MTPEALARLSTLLDEALALDETAREAWLAALPGDAADLAPTLRKLLARRSAEETRDILERPLHFGATAHADPGTTVFQPGDAVGPYRLLRALGHGGMGEVWQAERADGTLKRKVALKLPHVSWAPGLAERFAREREILASLEHPNIARLYDAGFDAHGRPYMALEYVEGLPIDAYCNRRALPVAGRLRLLLQVADAVAFAHSRLVVHRDLKPGNILVTEDGHARLLDFGIAKLMEGDSAQETALTRVGGRALTLDYASPEQIRGEPIGTASDVYSLGVVAFELLAGTRPYKLKRQSAAALEEAIASADVPLASAMAADAAQKKKLAGDLDAILNKALKKSAAERYPTVDALAQDWRRHLEGHAVSAHPDTLAYRLNRMLQRHRVPVAAGAITVAAFALALGAGATALVIFVLLLGLGAALWQARRAREQARRARVQAQTAEAVQSYLEGIFKANSGEQADPVLARQRSAKELLDEGATRIVRELDDVPEAKLRIVRLLAGLYNDMAVADRHIELRRLAVDVAGRAFPESTAMRVMDLAELAQALHSNNHDSEGDARLEEAQALVRANLGIDPQSRMAVQWVRVMRAQRRLDPTVLDDALALVAALRQQPPSMKLLEAMQALGAIERQANLVEQSISTLEQVIAIGPSVPGLHPHAPSSTYNELARGQASLGRMQDAEKNQRKAAELAEAGSGPGSVYTLVLKGNLANFLSNRGRLREAIEICDSVFANLPPESDAGGRARIIQTTSRILADAQRRLGFPQRAVETLSVLSSTAPGGQDSPVVNIVVELARAHALLDLGRSDACGEALREATSILTEKKIKDPICKARLAGLQVRFALSQGRLADALETWRVRNDDSPISDNDTIEDDARLALAKGDAAAACGIAELGLQQNALSEGGTRAPYQRFDLLLVLAGAQLALGKTDDALAAAVAALDLNVSYADRKVSPDRIRALGIMARIHLARGTVADARLASDEATAIRERNGELGPHILAPLDAAIAAAGPTSVTPGA